MNATESVHTPKELRDELKALVAEAETLLADAVTEPSTEALHELRERFAAAQEHLNVLYGEAKEKVVAGAKCTDAAIRENPYQSLAITLGVGLLVGVLLGRGSK